MSKSSPPPSHRPSNPVLPIPRFDGAKREEFRAAIDHLETKHEVMPSEKVQPATSMDPDPPIRPKYGEKNLNGEYEAGFQKPPTAEEALAAARKEQEVADLAAVVRSPYELSRNGTFEGGFRTPPRSEETFESKLASRNERAPSFEIVRPLMKRGHMLPAEKTQPLAATAPRHSEEGGHFGETNHNGFFGIGHPLAG